MERQLASRTSREGQVTAPDRDTLFVSDAELARRLGIDPDKLRVAIEALQRNRSANLPPFPDRDPLFSKKRYFPAVVAFFAARYGLNLRSPGTVPDGPENWG
jgi:hypothetical protein